MEGVNFFFVKKEVLQKMADGGQLAEWGEGPGGSLSGTAAASVQQVNTQLASARPTWTKLGYCHTPSTLSSNTVQLCRRQLHEVITVL